MKFKCIKQNTYDSYTVIKSIAIKFPNMPLFFFSINSIQKPKNASYYLKVKQLKPRLIGHEILLYNSHKYCMVSCINVRDIKADMKSYIPLETAAIFFSSEPISKTGY